MSIVRFIHVLSPFDDWTYDGIVLSGGPASVLGDEAPDVDERWLNRNRTLGVCYGMQMMAQRTDASLSVDKSVSISNEMLWKETTPLQQVFQRAVLHG